MINYLVNPLLQLDSGVYFVQIVSGDRLLWTGKGIVTN